MAITSETYDQLKIDKLKLYLQTQVDRGAARYFEIFVDNLKAVHKTNDINEFDSFEDYMTEDTERIRILVYTTNPTSPRNDQYVYKMKKPEEQKVIVQAPALSGIEIENRMEEKLQTHRDRWEHEALLKELEQTKQQLKESEEYAEKLVAELNIFRSKKLHWGNVNLGELASVVVEGIVRRNPQLVAKLPGGETLAGIIEDDNKERANPTTQVSEGTKVSFKMKGDEDEKEKIILTEEEKGYLNFMRGIANSFEDEEIIILTQVINKLEEDTTQLKPVAELLNIDVNEVLKGAVKS
jgi:hypothetical protein